MQFTRVCNKHVSRMLCSTCACDETEISTVAFQKFSFLFPVVVRQTFLKIRLHEGHMRWYFVNLQSGNKHFGFQIIIINNIKLKKQKIDRRRNHTTSPRTSLKILKTKKKRVQLVPYLTDFRHDPYVTASRYRPGAWFLAQWRDYRYPWQVSSLHMIMIRVAQEIAITESVMCHCDFISPEIIKLAGILT